MKAFRPKTVAEQLADHLRQQVEAGSFGGVMPGVLRLEAELGSNRKTVEAALRRLEAQGLLQSQGPGRRRRIRKSSGAATNRLRLAVLPYDRENRGDRHITHLMSRLGDAGHIPFHPDASLADMRMDLSRVIQLARRTPADAWIIVAGSREILAWFAEQPWPSFALFGRRRDLSIAGWGPHKPPAFAEAVRRLTRAGHRRIVLLTHAERRLPTPGASERAFLEALTAAGIDPAGYHLPDWEDSEEGFSRVLSSLFGVTPPTALIIETPELFVAAQRFLLHEGLRVPQDVSLVCADDDPVFSWCRPTVACIRWKSAALAHRILRWAEHVQQGRGDRRQSTTRAEFIDGGTIGPAPR